MFAHGAPLQSAGLPLFFLHTIHEFYFHYFFETNPSAAAQLYVAGSVVVVVDDW